MVRSALKNACFNCNEIHLPEVPSYENSQTKIVTELSPHQDDVQISLKVQIPQTSVMKSWKFKMVDNFYLRFVDSRSRDKQSVAGHFHALRCLRKL